MDPSTDFNLGQQIFLVIFSILYGVLLQSLPGGLFPLASSLRGQRLRSGCVRTRNRDKWFFRVCRSFFIFNFLPAVYLFKMLFVLSIVPTRFYSLYPFIYLLLIFGSSLGVFGFYRIYYIIISFSRKTILQDFIDIFNERGLSYDPLSHFCWVIFYFLPSLILYIISTRSRWFAALTFIIISFSAIIIWVMDEVEEDLSGR